MNCTAKNYNHLRRNLRRKVDSFSKAVNLLLLLLLLPAITKAQTTPLPGTGPGESYATAIEIKNITYMPGQKNTESINVNPYTGTLSSTNEGLIFKFTTPAEGYVLRMKLMVNDNSYQDFSYPAWVLQKPNPDFANMQNIYAPDIVNYTNDEYASLNIQYSTAGWTFSGYAPNTTYYIKIYNGAGIPDDGLVYMQVFSYYADNIKCQHIAPGDTYPGCTVTTPGHFIDGAFAAKKTSNGININWATATEANNEKFVVLASKNGNGFDEITTVKTKAKNGNSSQQLNYEVTLFQTNGVAKASMGIMAAVLLLSLIACLKNRKALAVYIYFIMIGAGISSVSCNKNMQEISASQTALNIKALKEYKYFKIRQVDIDGTRVDSKIFQVIAE